MQIRVLSIAFLLLISAYSSAKPVDSEVYPWGQKEEPYFAGVRQSIDINGKHVRMVSAVISHTMYGEQRLYLAFSSNVSEEFCEKDNELLYEVVRVEGQPIKMHHDCEVYEDYSEVYLTPYSKKGEQFVLDKFLKSKNPVEINFEFYTAKVPTKGFTKAWNSFGGDAL